MEQPLHPQRPSADITRYKILRAAKTLFAEKGFSATSISMIAKSAKINQSLIYHHFGDKQKLWQQVKSDLLQQQLDLNEADKVKFRTCASLEEFVRLIFKARYTLYDAHPEILRMLNWQRVESHEDKVYPIREEIYNFLLGRIKHFQSEAMINPKINPDAAVILMLTASASWYLDEYPPLSIALPEQLEEMKKQYKELAIKSVVAALQ